MKEWKLTRDFTYDGRIVRYDVLGEGKPVVVVHGTPWSSYNLRHIISDLSNDHQVYFFDLLGYGQSAKDEGNVSLGIQNEILSALIEHWNIDRPIIIGHDFGGATVLRSHLLNHVSFEKIVLIDPVAVSPWGSPFFNHVREHEIAFSGVPDYIHEAIVRAYIQTAAQKTIDSATLDQTVAYWTSNGGKPAFYRQIAQADSKYTDEVESLYSSVSTPTLILWGKEDTWIPLEKGKKIHKMIQNSILSVIADAGHLVIEEKPVALLNEIRGFIET